MSFLLYTAKEIIFFFYEISIYLLFGFFIAGLLHVLFPDSIIRRHLGHNTFGSVLKSTLFGIPLPLCSCGVVPVTASLKNSGASKGACISFLIATPQVGADSFFVTYSLLGWIFGLFRIVASLITAAVAGIVVNIFSRRDISPSDGFSLNNIPPEMPKDRMKSLLGYIEYDLLGSIANTLVIGIIVAGTIAAIIPDGFFEKYLGHPFISMLVMLAVGIPMYVCAAASTPIAASLIMKGLSPGAALVFLLTGPATNALTISTVIKMLGKRTAAVYLAAIGIISISLGYLLNLAVARYGFYKVILTHQHEMLPEWLKICGAAVLAAMLGWYYLKILILDKIKGAKDMEGKKAVLTVEGMTCMHCVSTVKKVVESIDGTSDVSVDLNSGKVQFNIAKEEDMERVKAAILSSGYSV